jgi:hypothetical protein
VTGKFKIIKKYIFKWPDSRIKNEPGSKGQKLSMQ